MRMYEDFGTFDLVRTVSNQPKGVQANYRLTDARKFIQRVEDVARENFPKEADIVISTGKGTNMNSSNVLSPKWKRRVMELSRYDNTSIYEIPVKKMGRSVLVGYIELEDGTGYNVNIVIPPDVGN